MEASRLYSSPISNSHFPSPPKRGFVLIFRTAQTHIAAGRRERTRSCHMLCIALTIHVCNVLLQCGLLQCGHEDEQDLQLLLYTIATSKQQNTDFCYTASIYYTTSIHYSASISQHSTETENSFSLQFWVLYTTGQPPQCQITLTYIRSTGTLLSTSGREHQRDTPRKLSEHCP